MEEIEGLKKQGNVCFTSKKFTVAAQFYTTGRYTHTRSHRSKARLNIFITRLSAEQDDEGGFGGLFHCAWLNRVLTLIIL